MCSGQLRYLVPTLVPLSSSRCRSDCHLHEAHGLAYACNMYVGMKWCCRADYSPYGRVVADRCLRMGGEYGDELAGEVESWDSGSEVCKGNFTYP